jgi:hypothetical protein
MPRFKRSESKGIDWTSLTVTTVQASASVEAYDTLYQTAVNGSGYFVNANFYNGDYEGLTGIQLDGDPSKQLNDVEYVNDGVEEQFLPIEAPLYFSESLELALDNGSGSERTVTDSAIVLLE